MTLYNNIMAARRNIHGKFGHIEALHLGSRTEIQFYDAIRKQTGGPWLADKWMGMPLEIGPTGTGPDYCAISWKREPRSPAILFEIIRDDKESVGQTPKESV